MKLITLKVILLFQSTPSVWRATLQQIISLLFMWNFNPHPPCGGRLYHIKNLTNFVRISIHTLRVEGDSITRGSPNSLKYFNPHPPCGGRPPFILHPQSAPTDFNPHPPCGGRLLLGLKIRFCQYLFQSTPSVWRATYKLLLLFISR